MATLSANAVSGADGAPRPTAEAVNDIPQRLRSPYTPTSPPGSLSDLSGAGSSSALSSTSSASPVRGTAAPSTSTSMPVAASRGEEEKSLGVTIAENMAQGLVYTSVMGLEGIAKLADFYAYLKDKTPAVVEKLRNGAPTPLLAELPKETKLTPQKMQEFEHLLDITEVVKRVVDGFIQIVQSSTQEAQVMQGDDASEKLKALASDMEQFMDKMRVIITNHPAFGLQASARPGGTSLIEWLNGLECYVMRRVHSRTFSAVNETALKDVKLFEKINSLKFVTMQHLDIPAPFHQPQLLESAKEELFSLNSFKTPLEKLRAVLKCCRTIYLMMQRSASGEVGADTFIPLLIFVIIRANPPQLCSNIEFISNFRFPSLLVAECAYYFVTFVSAVDFVEKCNAGSFGLTEENFKALSAASLSKPDNGAYAMESAQVKLRPQLRGASGARQPSVENRRTVATNQRKSPPLVRDSRPELPAPTQNLSTSDIDLKQDTPPHSAAGALRSLSYESSSSSSSTSPAPREIEVGISSRGRAGTLGSHRPPAVPDMASLPQSFYNQYPLASKKPHSLTSEEIEMLLNDYQRLAFLEWQQTQHSVPHASPLNDQRYSANDTPSRSVSPPPNRNIQLSRYRDETPANSLAVAARSRMVNKPAASSATIVAPTTPVKSASSSMTDPAIALSIDEDEEPVEWPKTIPHIFVSPSPIIHTGWLLYRKIRKKPLWCVLLRMPQQLRCFDGPTDLEPKAILALNGCVGILVHDASSGGGGGVSSILSLFCLETTVGSCLFVCQNDDILWKWVAEFASLTSLVPTFARDKRRREQGRTASSSPPPQGDTDGGTECAAPTPRSEAVTIPTSSQPQQAQQTAPHATPAHAAPHPPLAEFAEMGSSSATEATTGTSTLSNLARLSALVGGSSSDLLSQGPTSSAPVAPPSPAAQLRNRESKKMQRLSKAFYK